MGLIATRKTKFFPRVLHSQKYLRGEKFQEDATSKMLSAPFVNRKMH